jgi:hypothetical protein
MAWKICIQNCNRRRDTTTFRLRSQLSDRAIVFIKIAVELLFERVLEGLRDKIDVCSVLIDGAATSIGIDFGPWGFLIQVANPQGVLQELQLLAKS